MILRLAAVIALVLYVTSQFSLFVGDPNGPSATGWQLTHNQVDGTFQLMQNLSIVPQVINDRQNARYLVFMLGMSSATAGIVAAIVTGLFNRPWLCLVFSVAATTSAVVVLLHFLALLSESDQPFAFQSGAWIWLGSMGWLVLASVWTLRIQRRSLSSPNVTAAR